MKYIKSSVEWDYFDQFDPVLDNFLPPRGEGTNLAQQFTAAVNKLIYGWYSNRDIYDNTHKITGGDNDLSSYANWLAKHDKTCKRILSQIKNVRMYGQYEDILKELADYVWMQKDFNKALKTPAKDSIYDATGNYKWDSDKVKDVKAKDESNTKDTGNYIYVCEDCLEDGGYDADSAIAVSVDPNNEAESTCESCGNYGFSTLYKVPDSTDYSKFSKK